MKLLAIDTSTERMSLAVQNGEHTVTHQGAAGAQASAHLIDAVLGLLQQANVSLPSLQAIAFGQGPGAFTGLRTACSVSQGLALGLNIPMVPVDTLLCIAQSAEPAHHRVMSVLDARMGQVYSAAYERTSAGWSTVDKPLLSRPDELRWPAQWQDQPVLLTGNAVISLAKELAHLHHPQVSVQEQWPDARAMLTLAAAAWQRGDCIAAADAAPVYIRDEVARTTAQRLADKQAQP
jgi:tRNA threonylcarbamoyladenosine biosynthesis protein TsaB